MVYRPREDSYFLKDFIESQELEGKKLLDMGTGSGILAISAAEKEAEVVAADIDPDALEEAEKNAEDEEVLQRINFLESDLFGSIEANFDLVVFNPPYLPGSEEREGKSWKGGEKGIEVTERFLEEVNSYLEEGGEAVFLASSRSDMETLMERFNPEVIDSRETWFETLYLLRYK